MTTGPLPKTTLVAVVRIGGKEHTRKIATCKDFGLGSALGGGTERWLEAAVCGDYFWLISEPGRVSVVRKTKTGEVPVTHIDLPAGVRAVGRLDGN